jgi:hypothetical protein
MANIRESLRTAGVRDNLRSTIFRDEQEVWKVANDLRNNADPIAREIGKEKNIDWPHYGAVDTTVKNVLAIVKASLDAAPDCEEFLNQSFIGIDGVRHIVEEGLRGHINWIRKRMSYNREGLLEMLWLNEHHHPNQLWSDAPDSFHHKDGSWPRYYPDRNWGVAPFEVQLEVYDAFVELSDLYAVLQERASGARRKFYLAEIADLQERAARLKAVVMNGFWQNAQAGYGYYVRGTDRNEDGTLCPLDIRSADMGHVLMSRIMTPEDEEDEERVRQINKNLFSQEMLGDNGIQTMARDTIGFHEDRWQKGAVWPWVQRYIAEGERRWGYFGLAYELERRMMSFYFDTKGFLEYGKGGRNLDNKTISERRVVFDPTCKGEPLHGISNPANRNQGWTAAAILAIKYEHGQRLLRPDRALPTEARDLSKRAFEQTIRAQCEGEENEATEPML